MSGLQKMLNGVSALLLLTKFPNVCARTDLLILLDHPAPFYFTAAFGRLSSQYRGERGIGALLTLVQILCVFYTLNKRPAFIWVSIVKR